MSSALDFLSLGAAFASASGVFDSLIAAPDKVTLALDASGLSANALYQSLTDGLLSVESQFPVRHIGRRRVVQGPESQGFGDGPGTSFPTTRAADEYTFEMKWVAEDSSVDLTPTRDALSRMSDKDPATGTWPILRMSWGTTSIRCYISALDDDLAEGADPLSGGPRMYVARVTVKEVAQAELDSIADLVGEPSTAWHDAVASDSWEGLALQHYGNPHLGVRLAQVNRGRSIELREGDRIKVLPPTHSRMTGPQAPESVPLNLVPARVYQERAAQTVASSGGTLWESLDPRFTSDAWVD